MAGYRIHFGAWRSGTRKKEKKRNLDDDELMDMTDSTLKGTAL